MSQRTLKPEECYFYCDPTQFEFETTETVPPLEGIIGQERAVRAMEFGLMVKKHGYNIFITGPIGTGKSSYAQTIVKEVAKQKLCRMIGAMFLTLKTPVSRWLCGCPAAKARIL